MSIAASLTTKYCQTEAPKHNFVAVEAKCESLILQDVGLELTGTTDRIEQTPLGMGIRDIKSGKQAVGTDGKVKTDGHGAQMGVYELLAEAATGAGAHFLWLRFEPMSDALEMALERHLFRLHRRQIAQARLADRRP